MGIRLMQGNLQAFPQLHYSGSCELFLQFHSYPSKKFPFWLQLAWVSFLSWKLKTLSCIFLIFFNLQANTCILLYIDIYYIRNYRYFNIISLSPCYARSELLQWKSVYSTWLLWSSIISEKHKITAMAIMMEGKNKCKRPCLSICRVYFYDSIFQIEESEL